MEAKNGHQGNDDSRKIRLIEFMKGTPLYENLQKCEAMTAQDRKGKLFGKHDPKEVAVVIAIIILVVAGGLAVHAWMASVGLL
jgi:hypothetical protein